MNKFIVSAVFGLNILFSHSLLCASTVVISYDVSESRSVNMHTHIVQYTGLGKSVEAVKKDKYHLTVGIVKGVDGADEKQLKAFLKGELKNLSAPYLDNPEKDGVFAEFNRADRYLVNRKNHACPIVLYPSKGYANILMAINAGLSQKLGEFKAPSGKTYAFDADTQPGQFTPHITLADTKYIKAKGADRDDVIGKLNRNIKKYVAKGGVYRIALRPKK